MSNPSQTTSLNLANQLAGHVANRTITGAGTIAGVVSGFLILQTPATFTADNLVVQDGTDEGVDMTFDVANIRLDMSLQNVTQTAGKIMWFFGSPE